MLYQKMKNAKTLKRVFACLTILICLFMTVPALAQDPTGAKTGTLSDIDTMAVKVLDTVVNAKDTTVTAVSCHCKQTGNYCPDNWCSRWP